MVTNRGQAALLGIMIFIFTFIIATVLAKPIMDLTDTARDASNMNCEADNLTTGVAMTCIAVDLYLPFFIITVISVGAGYMTYKFVGD